MSPLRESVSLLVPALLGAWLGLVPSHAPAQQAPRIPAGVLVRVGADGVPEVVLLQRLDTSELGTARGLLIWAEGRTEAARVVAPSYRGAATPDALAAVSRFGASGGDSGTGATGNMLATVQLEQLRGLAVVRGEGFLTPLPGGHHLQPAIIIRRRFCSGPSPFPPVHLELRRGAETLARIPFPEGQSRLAWSEIRGLPERLKAGLPPGEYTLRAEKGRETVTFTVEDLELRRWVMEDPDALAALLQSRRHPLYLQLVVAHLLNQTDEQGRAQPYLADAVDLLESVAQSELTPYLSRLRQELLLRLESKSSAGPASLEDATGIDRIDAARRLLAAGRWAAASAELRSAEAARTPRGRALATLYGAVILSESSQTTDDSARQSFLQAIRDLQGSPTDLFRARNNYAGFLLGRTQDRLYNHAFQIASGVPYPLIRAMVEWRDALVEYRAAWTLAANDRPSDRAAVQVNLARLYALLADLIRTLDFPQNGSPKLADGHRAATKEARRLASAVACSSERIEDLIRGSAHEILAQLALRGGDAGDCSQQAKKAMDLYLRAGASAGAENVHRLLGILRLDQAETQTDPQQATRCRREGLNHLLVSHRLSEFLAEQLPRDRQGLSRAGFFARRAYVNERIAEALVAEGRPAQALSCLEAAKARSLEEVLCAGLAPGSPRAARPRDTAEVLAQWPRDLVALEYFLGTRRAWLFLITTSGEVQAAVLSDAEGRPLESRDLVARVQALLGRIDHQAVAMRRRLAGAGGFDHAWQWKLHEFRCRLLPQPVLDEMRRARRVLVVPHHVLHYFPMAALVTEPDMASRTAREMVKPKFLLDEPFDVSYAPSLAAWDLWRQRPDRPMRQANAVGISRSPGLQTLPGVERDLSHFRSAFAAAVRTVVSGDQASKERTKALLGQPGLLLLATHGQNLADQPLGSYLLFHRDLQNDGRLTAGEMFAHPVAADLVVMSACYSGLADRSPLPGDDLFGLQRAALHGGARGVVAGLWDVYDGTGPELMRRFFEGLAAGKTAPASLAHAQRELLASLRASRDVEPWLHPYFWAVYTFIGDDRLRLARPAP